jgi:hypothetical protein
VEHQYITLAIVNTFGIVGLTEVSLTTAEKSPFHISLENDKSEHKNEENSRWHYEL